MDIVKFSDSNLQSELKNLFVAGNLIPFIGSGFSKNAKTGSGNTVLDGYDLINFMKDKFVEYHADKKDRIRNKDDFPSVAMLYLKYVPSEVQLQVLFDYFINVDLEVKKSDFLKAGWPYIYTLNIDDGIERALQEYQVILPYRKLHTKSITTNKCIFKLHGDANYESLYRDEKNLVFSLDQYLISLRDNSDLLALIQSDYKTKSILIIGCSLDNEIDLKYAVLTNDGFDRDRNNRFYITKNEPCEDKKENLENLGISKIVLVEGYDELYDFFSSIQRTKNNLVELYKFKGYNTILDRNDNIDYYLGQYIIEDSIPKYKVMVTREKEHTKWDALKNANTVLVIGRRITGKTTFLINLLAPLSSRPVYFFSSQISVSVDFMKELEKLTNSIFVFDSDSILPDNLDIFNNFFKKISDNNNKLIVAANKSDRLFIALFNRMDFDLLIEIDKFPTEAEVYAINNATAGFGIPNISYKTSFIDNIARLNKTIYKNRKSIFPQLDVYNIQQVDTIIFILLASVNKVYYITFRHLGISLHQLHEFAEKYAPAVELYKTFEIESNMHSGIKLLANSRYWIISALADICKNNQTLIIDAVVEIVSKLYFTRDSFYCARQVLLFDNFNAIFSLFDTGVRHIPYSVYEKLNSILKDEPDYWLQRAKAIFRLSSRLEELKLAHEYAYKALIDFETKDKYSEKAVLTLAMIAGKRCKLTGYCDDELIQEAIGWYYQAIISEKNINYATTLVATAKKDKKRNDLYCFAEYLIKNTSKYSLHKNKVDEILTQVLFK